MAFYQGKMLKGILIIWLSKECIVIIRFRICYFTYGNYRSVKVDIMKNVGGSYWNPQMLNFQILGNPNYKIWQGVSEYYITMSQSIQEIKEE